MILGGVSALAVVAIVSFLVAVNRKRCCAHRHRKGCDDNWNKKNTKKVKKRKIGYDIPIESKPIISSVIWQQEENDIAEEVKRIYNNISNCSKPVLFDSGLCPQIDYNTNAKELQSMKVPAEENVIEYNCKAKKATLKLDLQLDVNKTMLTNQGHSSYRRQAGAFLSKDKVSEVKAQEVFMEEAKRSQVQEWVDNSVGTLNEVKEMGTIGKGEKVIPLKANKSYAEVEPQEGGKGKNLQWNLQNYDKKSRDFAENDSRKQENIYLTIKDDVNNELKDCDAEVHDVKGLKSCLKKGARGRDNVLEKSFEEIKECNGTSVTDIKEKSFNQRKLKFTENEDFSTTRDVRKLIVTSWIDHSDAQNKSCVTEEESDTTLAEKSANDLEYEDIDSILTSVSRMDEGRLSKLKASDFYKDLLKKKIKKYKDLGQKIDEVSLVSHEEERGVGVELENKRRQGSEKANEERFSLSKKNKQASTAGKEEINISHRNERESLSESSVLDQVSNEREKVGAVGERTKTHSNEELSHGSEISNDENDITLKYSIVRNFSDRLQPTIYVSLQHIHGLGKAFGYDNTAIARLYFANDGEEYEESEPMKCFDDIYQEQMFSVVGSSKKAIINDFLVIEIILEDNNEPELYITVPLVGLKHKATLIESVAFERGQFMEVY